MRNLKKVLSLVLCLAMMFSIMVVGAGAAFSDQDKIENTEAVDVCSALNIIKGMEDGAFHPEKNVKRSEMCKMICVALNKGVEPNYGTATKANFTDVPATHWAAPFIDYCVNAGIVAGMGNGTFKPDAEVTATQAAKMLLIALGYKAENEGYLGANWAINVNVDASEAGLYKGLEDIDTAAALNRDNAAQMIFNLLKGDMVKYKNAGSTITLPDGTTITNGAEAEKIKSATPDYTKDSDVGNDYQQFCEKFFPTLQLTEKGADNFGRPVNHKWTYGKDADVVYTDNMKPVLTITETMDKDELTKALKKVDVQSIATTVTHVLNSATPSTADWSTTTTFDAILADVAADESLNGNTVEFYANDKNELVKVVSIMPVFDELKTTDVKANGDTGAYTEYKVDTLTGNIFATETKTDKSNVVINGDVANKDMVLAYVDQAKVLHISAVNTVSGAVTAISSNDVYTIGDKQYELAGVAGAAAKLDLNKESAEYYVDSYGYVLGAKDAAKVASTDYAYVIDSNLTDVKGDWASGTEASKALEVRALLADGTVGIYNVPLYKLTAKDVAAGGNYNNVTYNSVTLEANDYVVKGTNILVWDASANSSKTTTNIDKNIFGYKITDKDIALEVLGTTLAKKDDVANFTLNNVKPNTNKYTASGNTVLADSNTKFVVYNGKDKTAEVYTGIANLPTTLDKTGYAVVNGIASKSGLASVVFVPMDDALNAGAAADLVYIDSTKFSQTADGYVYNAVKADGSTIQLTQKAKLDVDTGSGLYNYNEDNTIGTKNGATEAQLTVNGTLLNNGAAKWYNMTADTQIVYVDSKLDKVDGNKGYVVLDTVNADNVAVIFVTAAK